MDKFWVVTLFHLQPEPSAREALELAAISTFEGLGIEEFSLSEPEVDALLGDRSYSGGDLPEDVLDEVEQRVLACPTNYRFFFSSGVNAEGFLQYAHSQVLCEAQLEECESQDWNAEWKKHYSPILVGPELEVIPAWMKDYSSQAKNHIYINPGMGFGTGSHETTFLCLKLFVENLLGKKLETVLDFGSGSGILGLAALKLYPQSQIDFYDIDPEANKNCYQNAELNGLINGAFRLLLPEFRDKLQGKYDLVFANILESILIAEKDALVGHTQSNGHLILSGLLKHQVPNVLDAYSKSLTLVSHLEKGDWAALLFRKDG